MFGLGSGWRGAERSFLPIVGLGGVRVPFFLNDQPMMIDNVQKDSCTLDA